MTPILARITPPAKVISDAVIAEYVGYDPALDLSQDKVLPVLYRAAIEQGENSTCSVWAETRYRMEMPYPTGRAFPIKPLLSPILGVTRVLVGDDQGIETELDETEYSFIPSAIDLKRPWASIALSKTAAATASTVTLEFTAGWTEATLPDSLRTWALVRMATLYDYREDLVTGTIASNMPRDHTVGLLDRWRVYGDPYAQ